MSVTDRLPNPENWRSRPALTAVSLVLGLCAIALGSWWSVVALSRAEYATAFVAVGYSAAFLCLMSAIAITKLGWVHARPVTDKNGTVVPIDRVVSALYIATAILIIPCGIAALVFGFMGKLDLPVSGDRSQAFLALLVGFAVIGGISMVGALFARGGLGHVYLMPSGFEISELRRTGEGLWDDVTDVSDETSDRRAAQPIELVMKDGSTHVINGAATYTPHGAVLYWMVRYWLHPEDRAELTDGRAVERLRNEDFDTAS